MSADNSCRQAAGEPGENRGLGFEALPFATPNKIPRARDQKPN